MDAIFAGEEMACILCPRRESSDPRTQSDWRCVEADGTRYYVCPDHFPADGASAAAYQKAYDRVLDRIIELRRPHGLSFAVGPKRREGTS